MTRSFARRDLLGASAATVVGLGLAGPLASPARAAGSGEGAWPRQFPLPDGFQPEGITIGPGPYAYFGSIASGDVYRVALATGTGSLVSEGLGPAHPVIGLKSDGHSRLFLSGGASRELRTVDRRTGRIEDIWTVGSDGTFVNDVVLTPGAAWFTDSFAPQLYRLSLDRHGTPGTVRTVPLTGDWAQGPDFTANGIARTPDGGALLVVNQFVGGGGLMRVDPRTGAARAVDLGGSTLPNGDGLLLLGRTLYCVQQRQNAIDVFRMNASGTRGTPLTRITDPRFRIPTTVASWGDRLYLPNARFGTPPGPTTDYDAVAVARV
ncbi:SMP-30/gluconolactonase/LRE family protein [Streptomyces sp. NPDC058001]|uniref:SMP-30/gluconolactonase/LRE family protein n=1 Tax=Streptomyces sp. NPDC058001 TaxID=3346300 RepID=UPI0036EDE15E